MIYDFSKYIGIPYKNLGRTREGCDCWGLLRIIYQEEFDMILPEYDGLILDDAEKLEIERIINSHREDWEQVDIPVIGDGVLMNVFGLAIHIGVYIGNRQMIQAMKGADSCIVRLDNKLWKPRFAGFWRHRDAPWV